MILDYNFLPFPIGLMLLATEQKKLCWLSMGTEKDQLLSELQRHYPKSELQLNERLDLALAAVLPLKPKGTPWQQRVWHELLQIPRGNTISYSELAIRCAKPKAARAVASACAKNPIALFIPCHRVVAKSGALSGYRWGVKYKQWLLESERSHA